MTSGSPEISIVIPTWNEAGCLARTLDALALLNGPVEILVVDGGSTDGTLEIASALGVRVMAAERGRGLQLHAGACATRAPVLWFLHADTIAPPDSVEHIRKAIACSDVAGGNFTLRFDGESCGARQLTFIYPKLRRLGLCYGDSGIFVRRTAYEQIDGFRPYPIFEDVDLVRRLQRVGRFAHLDAPLTTSSRRFEGRSFGKTFAHWSALQLLFWMGVSPARLGRWYAPIRASRRA